VEWVETIGRTVEEAVETALEQLGVAETDAEIVIVEEPKSGMFGLRRSSARIRARVRPVQPRAKRPSHRPRASVGSGERGQRRQAGRSETPGRQAVEKNDVEDSQHEGKAVKAGSRKARGQARPARKPAQNGSQGSRARDENEPADAEDSSDDDSPAASTNARRRPARGRGRSGRDQLPKGSEPMAEDASGGAGRGTGSPKEAEMSIETQQQLACDFVSEVVARFGIDATTSARRTEDDGIYISVDGENLGLLVGPKGATVEALQELTRTVVQRHTEEHTNRIIVDVGGYRERRAAALRQFVLEAAADVLRTGIAEALEPMSPSDRKIVHDTVNDLEGLETTSEGIEPRRYVLIRLESREPGDGSASLSAEDPEDVPSEAADLS